MQISDILARVEYGSLALPTFQRGYVWNREQVRGLMNSLYRRHPIGSLLVWITRTDGVEVRGDAASGNGTIQLLLDGQQRVTTLYGIIHGKPPAFFDGNAKTFTGLRFNLLEETFEFYQPSRMLDDPMWIDVTELIQRGIGPYVKKLSGMPDLSISFDEAVNRLNAIATVGRIDLHFDEVTGEDKSIDVVVDIFNRVNSGGTKLSKGDLALAKICAGWPEARDEMKGRLGKWEGAGFNFKLDWLLRCINTILTGEALFAALEKVNVAQFKGGLDRAEKAIDSLLNLISSRLGLDHDRVLGSRYSFPVLARFLDENGGDFGSDGDQGKLLYWYINTMLRGRYSGSTESTLNQDLGLIENREDGLDRLIDQLRQQRGDLAVKPEDFLGWSRSARFYPLLYMLSRVQGARDWGTGIELSKQMLGAMGQLHLHHIFPKSLLYKAGHSRPDVNSLANLTFLTGTTNRKVSNRDPAEYMPEYLAKHAGAVESHWMPVDPELWSIDRYHDFLAARRELLAAAANRMLDRFLSGSIDTSIEIVDIVGRDAVQVPGGVASEDEEKLLQKSNAWVIRCGLPAGEMNYELTEPESGEALAVIDLAWPDGLQSGLSDPVALLIDEDAEIERIVNGAGYRSFTSLGAFQHYVALEVLPGEVAA